jgi:excisionase family DNA binding protein
MKDSTFKMVKLAVESDETVADADRQAILAFCCDPVRADHSSSVAEIPQLLSVGHAASLLAVHPRTVWRLIRMRRLRSVMVGSSRRVRMDDLTAFVDGGRDAPGRGGASVFSGSTSTAGIKMAKAS